MPVGFVILVAVAAGLVYVLVSLKRAGYAEAAGLNLPDAIGGGMTVLRTGDEDVPDGARLVSTPLLRADARHEVARARRRSLHRRQAGLLLAVLAAGGIVAAGLFAPISGWWAAAAPLPLIVWVWFARFSVRVVHRLGDARLASVDEPWDEKTQLITADVAPAPVVRPAKTRSEMSVELSVPLASTPSLLEPLPVTPPPYVARPLLPRSQRLVDLSAPLSRRTIFPVSAEYPQDVLPFDAGAPRQTDDSGELPLAVGE